MWCIKASSQCLVQSWHALMPDLTETVAVKGLEDHDADFEHHS
jgi:hypothetical protein